MNISEEKMRSRLIKVKQQDGTEELVYVTRGIFDYLDEKNFQRLYEEYKFAHKSGARFYVGLYTDELMERTKHTRELKDKVSNQDRVNLVEALDFVDGAFLIDALNKEKILQSLRYRMLEKKYSSQPVEYAEKKYELGYASGAFSNLHKGHIEHLKMMSEQCKKVIVAVNSDRLIQNYKHKTASVSEDVRREILSHIRYVDFAIIADEYDKIQAVENIRKVFGKTFNAIFVGSDWKGNPKWDDFQERFAHLGIDVVFTDRPENGISTTAIDNKKRKQGSGVRASSVRKK